MFPPVICHGQVGLNVVPWGNMEGWTPEPPWPVEAVAIAAGNRYSVVIQPDREMLVWGTLLASAESVPGPFFGVSADYGNVVGLWGPGEAVHVVLGPPTYAELIPEVPPGEITAVAAGQTHGLVLDAFGTVVGWGNNTYQQIDVPPSLQSVEAIAAGRFHSLAVQSNGTVEAWGENSFGQCDVPGDLADVVAVAGGRRHSLALKSDGTLVVWGGGPVYSAMPPGLDGIVAIASGPYHALALRHDGTVVGWGRDTYGESTVPGGLTGVVAVAAGESHSLAMLGSGTGIPVITVHPFRLTVAGGSTVSLHVMAVGSWPMEYQWQFEGMDLPDATNATLTLTGVGPGDAGFYRVSVTNGWGGAESREALLTVLEVELPTITSQPTNQTLWAGDLCRLDVGAVGTEPLAYLWYFEDALLPGATDSWLEYSAVQPGHAGDYFAVVSNAFGAATSDVATVMVLDPQPVITLHPTNRSAWAGESVTIEVQATGRPPLNYQWFFNSAPLTNAGPTLNWPAVQTEDAGGYFTVVANTSGAVTSDVATVSVLPREPAIMVHPTDETVYIGEDVQFSVTATGYPPMVCQWQFDGVVLPGETNWSLDLDRVREDRVGHYAAVVSNAYAAVESSTALLEVISVEAWGNNSGGQTNVPTGWPAVSEVTGGSWHSLALHPDGTLTTWGYNGSGQLDAPIHLALATDVAGGRNHSLALQVDGRVLGWGDNLYQQIDVPLGLADVVAIGAGFEHSLALRADGSVVAWGSRWNDEEEAVGQATVPTTVRDIVAIKGGSYHNLALQADGRVVAWGDDRWDQCQVPPGLSNVTAVAAGYAHCLALRGDGTVSAWGNDDFGQAHVPADLTNAVAVVAGYLHSLALRNDGTLASWGSYWNGEEFVPMTAPAFPVLVGDIGCGSHHNLARLSGDDPAFVGSSMRRQAYPGDTVTLNAGAVGSEPLYYQWIRDDTPLPGEEEPWLTLTNVQPTENGLYRVAVSNASGSITGSVAELTVVPREPIIVMQPTNLLVNAGDPAFFGVHATGWLPLEYAWYHNSNLLPDEHEPRLVVPEVAAGDTGTYSVVVFNAYDTVPGDPATLSIAPQVPVITDDPESQEVAAGSDVTFVVAATGPELSFQWQFNGSDLVGATATGLTLSNVQAVHAGEYRLVVDNPHGAATSQVAVLTVTSSTPWIVEHPESRHLLAGSLALFDVVARGSTPLQYQWLLNGTAVPGATGPTFALVYVQKSQEGDYAVLVENAYGSITSSIATLTIDSPPVITQQPQSRDVRHGTNVTFAVTASGNPPMSYQWQFWGANLDGETNASLVLSDVEAEHGGDYRVIVVNPLGTTTSSTATLTVGYEPVLLVEPSSQTACDGDHLSLYVDVDGTWPLQFQWCLDDTPLDGATDPTLDFCPARPLDSGAYLVVIANAYGAATSAVAHLTVEPLEPATGIAPSSLEVCAGDAVAFEALASGCPPLSYQWYRNGGMLSGATNRVLSLPHAGMTHNGEFRVDVWNGFGPIASAVATLTVHRTFPLIVLDPESQDACEFGDIVFHVETEGCPPLSYQWQFFGLDLPGATNAALVLTNVQVSDTGPYEVIVSNAFGVATSAPVDLNIVSEPVDWISVPITNVVESHAYDYAVRAETLFGYSLTYNAVVLPDWLAFSCDTGFPPAGPLSAPSGTDPKMEQQVALGTATSFPFLPPESGDEGAEAGPWPVGEPERLPEARWFEGEGLVQPTVKSQTAVLPAGSAEGTVTMTEDVGDPVDVRIDAYGFPDILLWIRAVDVNGDPIPGLTQGDFLIQEQSSVEPSPTVEVITHFEEMDPSDVSVALVFDISGSMGGQRLEDAKSAAIQFLDVCAPNTRASLVVFSSGTNVRWIWGVDEVNTDLNLNGIRDLDEEILDLEAGGLTAMFDGTAMGIDSLSQEAGRTAVIVFTDGGSNDDHLHDVNSVIDLANSEGTPLYTIGVGSGTYTDLLSQMASQTGGAFFNPPTPAEMAQVYQDIAAEIFSSYLIGYTTHNPARDYRLRTVTVDVVSEQGVGEYWPPNHVPEILMDETLYEAASNCLHETDALPILGWVTDLDASVPEQDLTGILHYRPLGGGSVTSTNLAFTDLGAGIYAFSEILLPGAVAYPGLELQIEVSDGIDQVCWPGDCSYFPFCVATNRPPVIDHVPITSAPFWEDLLISATVFDIDPGDFVTDVRLYYRVQSESPDPYTEVFMVTSGMDIYEGIIPAESLIDPAVEYYISAWDSYGARTDFGSAVSPFGTRPLGCRLEGTPGPEDVGEHLVVVEVDHGGACRSMQIFTVTVHPRLPEIVAQPEDRSAFTGSEVTFRVTATGTGPLWYQWMFEGAPLPGATDSVLVLPHVSLAETGTYSAVVSNLYGMASSSNAVLSLQSVVAWGWNGASQTNVPANLPYVVDVAAGLSNSLALREDGSVVVWGATNEMYNVPADLTNAVVIAAGWMHALALTEEGKVVEWERLTSLLRN